MNLGFSGKHARRGSNIPAGPAVGAGWPQAGEHHLSPAPAWWPSGFSPGWAAVQVPWGNSAIPFLLPVSPCLPGPGMVAVLSQGSGDAGEEDMDPTAQPQAPG